MEQADYDAIESLVAAYFAENGPLPDHNPKGARCEWFVGLLEALKEDGFGNDFVFLSSSTKSAWSLIMSSAFNVGSGSLNKRQRDLRENIIKDLRAAIAIANKEERLSKAKRIAPEREETPDIREVVPESTAEIYEAPELPEKEEPEEDDETPDPSYKPKEFANAAEANAGLKRLEADFGPGAEPVYNEKWLLAFGHKEEDE